jgi:hypothetical protein
LRDQLTNITTSEKANKELDYTLSEVADNREKEAES